MSDAADAGWPDIAGRIEDKSHVLAVRVYYEDTDFSGRVYHANYLKFCERGRSDMLRLAGIHHHELAGGEGASGLAFAVTAMEVRFLKPAAIDDVVEVRTSLDSIGRARIVLDQQVVRGGEALFTAKVTAAMVDRAGRPRPLPDAVKAGLASLQNGA